MSRRRQPLPAVMPAGGWLERRRIGARVYRYWRWREGKRKRSLYLGVEVA